MFREMINRALEYKQNPSDFMDEVMQELEVRCSIFRFLFSITFIMYMFSYDDV